MQTCTEPVPLKYGKLATKYPCDIQIFLQCSHIASMLKPVATYFSSKMAREEIVLYVRDCCTVTTKSKRSHIESVHNSVTVSNDIVFVIRFI